MKVELNSNWKRDCYLKDRKFFFNNKFLIAENESEPVKSIDFKQKLSALTFDPMNIEAQSFISNFETIVNNLELSQLAKARIKNIFFYQQIN